MRFLKLNLALRITISIVVAFFVIGSTVIIEWNGYKENWQKVVERHEYEAKEAQSLSRNNCDRIRKGLAPEGFDCNKINYDNKYANKYDKYINEVVDDVCNKVQNGNVDALLREYDCSGFHPLEVTPFSTYIWEEHLSYALLAAIAIAAALFGLLTTANRYLVEPSHGWKRLSLVSSAVMSVLIGAYYYDDSSTSQAIENGLIATSISFPVSLFALLYSKVVYEWVKAGFGNGSGSPETSTQVVPQVGEPTNQGILAIESPIESVQVVTSAVAVEKVIPTPTSSDVDEYQAQGSDSRTPSFWTRLWARGIDLAVIVIVASIVVELLPQLPQISSPGANIIIDMVFWIIVLCIFTIGYEVVLLSLFGATLGKLTFGIKVYKNDGGLLNGSEAYDRTSRVLKSGLGFMLWFPWFQGFLAYEASKYLKKNSTTKWDAGFYVVKQKPIGAFRWSVGMIVAVSMLAAVVLGQQVAKQQRKEQIRHIAVDSALEQLKK